MKKRNNFQKFWFLGLLPTVASILVLANVKCFRMANLLQIQFSNNFKAFTDLVGAYDKTVLTNNHFFDFFFILCYTLLFLLSLKLIGVALDFHFKKGLYLLCLLPGLLDVLENVLFLDLIADRARFFDIYFWSVRLKWGIAVVFIQLVLAILLFYLMLNGYHLMAKLWAFFKKQKPLEQR